MTEKEFKAVIFLFQTREDDDKCTAPRRLFQVLPKCSMMLHAWIPLTVYFNISPLCIFVEQATAADTMTVEATLEEAEEDMIVIRLSSVIKKVCIRDLFGPPNIGFLLDEPGVALAER